MTAAPTPPASEKGVTNPQASQCRPLVVAHQYIIKIAKNIYVKNDRVAVAIG